MAIYINGKCVASIHTSVIDPAIVHETGNSVANVMSQAGSTNSFANALKGKAIGSCVSIDDLTPFEAKVKTVVKSKNLCPISDKTVSGTNAWTASIFNPITVDTGKVYTVSADFVQTGADSSIVQLAIRRASNVNANITSTQQNSKNGKLFVSFTVPNDETGVIIVLYSNLSANALNTSCTFSNIQLEEGSTATAFTPYIADGTAVTVKTCGKNLFNPSKLLELDGCTEKNGVYSFAGSTFYYAFSTTAKPLIDRTFFEEGKQYTISFDGKHERDEGNPSAGMCFLYEDGTLSNCVYINSNTKKRYTLTSDAGKKIVGLHSDIGWDYNVEMSNIICCDGIDTVYEPYIEGETISTAFGETVKLAPITPHMTIATDKSLAVVHAEYNKDTNKVIEELTKNGVGGTSVTIAGKEQETFPADTYIAERLAELVNSAPATLDTLAEIATALGNDPSFATTILAELGKKADKTDTVNHEQMTEEINSAMGDISSALDELHAYAQALANGGAD